MNNKTINIRTEKVYPENIGGWLLLVAVGLIFLGALIWVPYMLLSDRVKSAFVV